MSKLSELTLKEDVATQAAGDWADLPEQLGAFADPPQPGTYRVRFPSAGAIGESWDVFDVEKPQPGQRIVAKLQGDAALLIVQSPGGKYNGEPLETRISNAERKRGKDADRLASDMDYALQATKFAGKKPAFGANRVYADAFLSVANKEVKVDWEFTYYCNPKRPARMIDENNGVIVCDGAEGRPDQKGCGARYYQKDVPKQPNDAGEMMQPVVIECGACQAQIRAFGQIARFIPVD